MEDMLCSSFFVPESYLQCGKGHYLIGSGKGSEKLNVVSGDKKKGYLLFLYTIMISGIFSICGLLYYSCWLRVPDSIRLYSGSSQALEFKIPASGKLYTKEERPEEAWMPVSLSQPLTIVAGEEANSYVLDVRLLGFIPVKEVNIQVIDNMSVIPAGIPVGIYVKTQGVLVVDVGEFNGPDGISCAPSKNILRAGDYIMTVNGNTVESKASFMESIRRSGGMETILEVKRGEEVITQKVQPMLHENGDYKIGIWIRDNAQGVGTLTYIDAEGRFGALGHGINDIDTSTLMKLENGSLYATEIVGVRKGANGAPGELTGIIDYDPNNQMGSILSNTGRGIFGVGNAQLIQSIQAEPAPIALKQEVALGKAEIICSILGEPKKYEVEITELHLEKDDINRGIILKITDPELLELTGGIVQGMSGSPILQNGKIIGAVTHVLVRDSTCGYGIFIENMLAQ